MMRRSGGMRVRLFFVINLFIFIILTCFCSAQNNRTESLTITTYYPAPYGVYKNLRLVPIPTPIEPADQQGGTLFFNESDKKLYFHNGTTWQKFGSGASAGSGLKIESGHLVSPEVCGSTLVTIDGKKQVCDYYGWFKDIVFTKTFSNPPEVIVALERAPDADNSPCTDDMTNGYKVYAENIKTTGFRVQAAAGIKGASTCGAYSGWISRAKVGWIAIGG
ncbi:MAG: H-type lectin domain-containing protein [Candidatus Omnitrophica bacterium]|nr:H-type lectin domain-containing protein [Candidatus Omnitrophota bacterium]